MAAYRDKRDLIAIGAYERGSDPLTDKAIDLKDAIDGFLKQKPDEAVPGPDSDDQLLRTARRHRRDGRRARGRNGRSAAGPRRCAGAGHADRSVGHPAAEPGRLARRSDSRPARSTDPLPVRRTRTRCLALFDSASSVCARSAPMMRTRRRSASRPASTSACAARRCCVPPRSVCATPSQRPDRTGFRSADWRCAGLAPGVGRSPSQRPRRRRSCG